MFDWVKNLFKEKPKSRLGIDLGSSIIKIVEVEPGAGRMKLKTYGLASFSTEGFLSHAFSSFVNTTDSGVSVVNFEEKGGITQSEFLPSSKSTIRDLANREIGEIIKELILKARVETNIAYFSVPSFATFSTIVTLPAMPPEEIAAAIPYEAKKYIPVPLDDVVLDWVLIGEAVEEQAKKELLSPQIDKLGEEGKIEPAENSGVEAKNQQAIDGQKAQEDKKEKSPDLQKSNETTELGKGESNSLEQAGSEDKIIINPASDQKAGKPVVKIFLVAILKEIIEKYTQIAQVAGLEIRVLESESFCLARSLASGTSGLIMILDIGDHFIDITLVENGYVKVIHNAESVIDSATKTIDETRLLKEIEKVLKLYSSKLKEGASPAESNSAVFKGKFIVTGGKVSAYKLDYLKERFNAEIIFGYPFSQLEYPPVLEPVLKELAPSLAVAVGMAMRV